MSFRFYTTSQKKTGRGGSLKMRSYMKCEEQDEGGRGHNVTSDSDGLEVDLSEDVSGACLSLSSARICVCALPPWLG